MQFHEVRYFLALSETLNFTRAAALCNVSQPALTRAIRSLEDKLGGGPLIHRERNSTHLAELGRIMKPYFEEVIGRLRQARRKAQSYSQMTRASLSVGLLCTIGPAQLVDFFARFAKQNPQIEIHLRDGSANQLEAELLAGEIDVALLARPGDLEERLHGVALLEEAFVVAVAPDDPLAAQPAIRMRDLNGRRYLGRANCEFYEHLREIRRGLGDVEFECPYTSDRDDWIQAMVLAGLGFTYLPEFAVAMPALAVRPLVEPRVTRTVQLATVRGRPHAPAVGAFVRAARAQDWAGKLHPGRIPVAAE